MSWQRCRCHNSRSWFSVWDVAALTIRRRPPNTCSAPWRPHFRLRPSSMRRSPSHWRCNGSISNRSPNTCANSIAKLPTPCNESPIRCSVCAGSARSSRRASWQGWPRLDAFQPPAKTARYAGLVWLKRASGRFVAEETRLTKTGNSVLRYYLIEGADRMRQWDTEYQAYYWRKFREVPKHQHKRALVLTARKLIRLVHALLTSNHPDARPQTQGKREEGITD